MKQAPAVGNVLGFSLLLRERRALLRLDERILAPGVTVRDYEAEIPGVQFPMRAPLSAAVFRHRHCRVSRTVLALDRHALQGWLERSLVGTRVAEVEVRQVDIDLCAKPDPDVPPVPCLRVHGQARCGQHVSLFAALAVRPMGHRVRLEPVRLWLLGFGEQAPDADALWQAVVGSLGESPGRVLLLDPGWHLLMPAFVAAGWKAPDTSELRVHGLAVTPQRIELEMVAGEPADEPSIGNGDRGDTDAIRERLERCRDALRQGQIAEAIAGIDAVASLLHHYAPARRAALQWLAEVSRHAPDSIENADQTCIGALTQWLKLRPNDALARRWLVEALARSGRLGELTRFTAAARELARSPRTRARFDLALGSLLAQNDDDRPAARALLAPWIEQSDRDPELTDLRVPLQLAMARARIDDPRRALESLQRALEEIPDAPSRADAQVELAAALVEHGHAAHAVSVLRNALRDDPDHPRVAEVAGSMARQLGTEVAVVDPPEPAVARERLIESAEQPQKDTLQDIEDYLDEHPDDVELRRAAVRLCVSSDQHKRAARHLLALRLGVAERDEEMGLRWERARELIAAGLDAQVWPELSPALQHLDEQTRAEATFRAVEFAPSAEIQTWIDTLAANGSPNELLAALHARWQRWASPDTGATMLARMLLERGDHDAHRRLCRELAERTQGSERVQWLIAAAEGAPAEEAADLMEAALQEAPGDPSLEERLATALERTGQVHRLAALWAQQQDDERRDASERIAALDRRIALRTGRSSLDAQVDGAGLDPDLLELYRARVVLRDDEPHPRLVLAERARRHGKLHEAEDHLSRALELLPRDDRRAVEPALFVAERRLAAGDAAGARELLRRIMPMHEEVDRLSSLLHEAAEALEDDELARDALTLRLETTQDPARLAATHLRLAQLEQRRGALSSALSHTAEASRHADKGSALHLEIAEAWLELVRDHRTEPRHEAEARAELREALGPDLPSAQTRQEALLWGTQLGEPERGIDLIEAALRQRPDDDLLLSTLKELCAATTNSRRYLSALGRALEQVPAGPRRDALIVEMGSAAVELDEPQLALDALQRLTTAGSTTPEALDLRDWAVHRLGREDDELREIDERLCAGPGDPAALARLERVKTDELAIAEHLLGLATRTPPPTAAGLVHEALSRSVTAGSDGVATRALRRALELSGQGHEVASPDELRRQWVYIFDRSLERGDAGVLADLLALHGDITGDAAGRELPSRVEAILRADAASPHVFRLLWEWARQHHRNDATREALAVIDAACADDPVRCAEHTVALAEQLERRDAASVLRNRAAAMLAEPAAGSILLTALQDAGHVSDVIRLLERWVAQTDDVPGRVAAYKRLAHLHGDTLGDPARAAEALERALELAPTDPDLLLPLLDRCFERSSLERAVELTARVLDHVPMGDTAFLALAHRGADAALAQGLHEEGLNLLRVAERRAPDDRRTTERLTELEAIRGAPEHRVELLATIAERQAGQARWEALEERARLLVDPLGRHDDAIEALETIRREDPGHEQAGALLRRLYAGTGRWRELARLLEDEFPRHHGTQRCVTLRELAMVYRDRLMDLPRAEQALRVALDHLGDGERHRDLAEQMRKELVGDLEAQGRYVDLSIYLERALASEIEGTVDPSKVHPTRVELLVELARIYRGPLDDEGKAGRIYERLEALGSLPDEGLATLARTYHRSGRHADLVRILDVRARALAQAGEFGRKATVDQRIAAILEGPLTRPHEAAPYYLDAYLADPETNASAGARARVLLSGTASVVSVRQQLLDRLERLDEARKPVLLTLLGDILGPHEDHEEEAERRYREALACDPDHAMAHEGLGRLLARQGRLEDAVVPLIAASKHSAIEPQRAAEDAAIAARALLELDRPQDAEEALRDALHRAPDSQRALLELARLYEKLGQTTDQAIVLESLSQLPLSSMLGAEVAYRRAMLLMATAREDAYAPEAERARAYLLEAVSADNKHASARQVLLELAKARLEWSVVAHMHYLTIRELEPGPPRALVHLDLAETYLHRLSDPESATRNIESATLQGADDVVVVSRASKLATELPDPCQVAERFERLASRSAELDDIVRARLWLLAADLYMRGDDLAAAETASQRVLDLQAAPEDARAAAHRNLDALADDEARELRQQKSGLLRLLESEDQAVERLHILGRLREIGQSLGDDSLVEWTSREQIDLAGKFDVDEKNFDAASAALREVFAERGSYDEIVQLYEQLAQRTVHRGRRADALVEAARFSWHGMRSAERAITLVRRALSDVPEHAGALELLGELSRASEDEQFKQMAYAELQKVSPRARPLLLSLELAELADSLGKPREAIAQLRPLCVQTRSDEVRFRALRKLDSLLSRVSTPAERLPTLRRYFEEATRRGAEDLAQIAHELARTEIGLDDSARALEAVDAGLEYEPDDLDLLRLRIELLENVEDWAALADSLERLAAATPDVDRQVELLVRSARTRLAHESSSEDASVRGLALSEARRVLIRARELGDHVEPRAVLLPLSFSERRWDEVLALAAELRRHSGDDHDSLILAGLAEAYDRGQRALARDLGFRHGPTAHDHFLYPGLRQLLTEVATRGPLPRLDSLLAAAAALCGGRVRLAKGMRAWAAGRPVQAGLALGLARLAEADGEAELARSLYQISAFMAPDGPVPALVARLPLAEVPDDLDPAGNGPMQGRSSLRALFAQLGPHLADFTHRAGTNPSPPNEAARSRLTVAESIVEPWRRKLKMRLPLVWTTGSMRGGVGVQNRGEPSISVGPGVAVSSLPELRFRLASAVASISTGLALVDCGTARLEDFLDALRQLLDASHEPATPAAQAIADLLAGAEPAIPAGERKTVARELQYWLEEADGLHKLRTELRRARLLYAVRLSGQLDGALLTLAHDHGFVSRGRPDPFATLRTEDAHWLLRGLGLY